MSRQPKPAPTDDSLHPGVGSLSDVMDRHRLTYRLDELSEALGVSRRTIERERSAGRFPRPDLTMGKMPLWRAETIRAWVEGGGQK
jgi:predicted DNA-binding transcriptional regulator AlpA